MRGPTCLRRARGIARELHGRIFRVREGKNNKALPSLTQLLDEVLHVQVEGVQDRAPRLIAHSLHLQRGQAASHRLPLQQLDPDAPPELLPEEISRRRAPDATADHGCEEKEP